MIVGSAAPSLPIAPPPLELTEVAVFPEKIQLLIKGEAPVLLYIAPPALLVDEALLPENTQLLIVGETLLLYIPPPWLAEPPVTVKPSSTAVASRPVLALYTTALPLPLPFKIVALAVASRWGKLPPPLGKPP